MALIGIFVMPRRHDEIRKIKTFFEINKIGGCEVRPPNFFAAPATRQTKNNLSAAGNYRSCDLASTPNLVENLKPLSTCALWGLILQAE